MRQRELEIRLESVPPPPRPSPSLEQYRTPPKIAADLLYRALAHGDLLDRSILDLGCGTGMFAIGACLLGAREALGIDVDEESLHVARDAADRLGVAARFQRSDVADVTGDYDAVLMNPPFGAQFGARHLDSRFVEVAVAAAPVVYSLHLAATVPHLERLASALGVGAETLRTYDFPLPAQFAFHQKERHIVRVALVRFARPPL